jgi:hypothetical protein
MKGVGFLKACRAAVKDAEGRIPPDANDERTRLWPVLTPRAANHSLPKLHRRQKERVSGLCLRRSLCQAHAHSLTSAQPLLQHSSSSSPPPPRLRAYHHIIKNHPISIEPGSVSPDTCRYPHHARTREQATRARQREHQEAQGARAERKTRRRKTRTRQALGSSSWPRKLTHRLSLLSQTETSELKRRALFLAGI